MRIAVVIFALSFSTHAIAACERNEHGFYEDIACAADAMKVAGQEMESVYRKVLESASPEAQQATKETQKAWEIYRTAAVQFVYAQEGDGSAGRLVVANETERALRSRALELKQWLPR